MSLWNMEMDWDSEVEVDAPSYDPAILEELMQMGYTYEQALVIATTEMDGASETKGMVHSMQTYCNILNEES
jgi:hypothetical protein